MPSIKIKHEVSLSPEDCFQRVTKMFETDRELKKLDPGFACSFDSSTLSGTAEGKQFKAQMRVEPSGGGSKIELAVDLPFHLGLIKALVQKTLEKKLNEALA